MNRAFDPKFVAELRKNIFVQQWIKDYQESINRTFPDCHHCGWPHYENLLCGPGTTFGLIRLGGVNYYLDTSNIEFMIDFVQNKLGPGFHWKNEIFFDVVNENVTVSYLESFNNTPHIQRWIIPPNEWKSIVDFVAERHRAKEREKGE